MIVSSSCLLRLAEETLSFFIMKGTMADYQIASVAETAIMDVYPYSAEPDDKPEV
jgi:hypothetical protein